MNEVKEFVIYRDRWARRGKNGDSMLLNGQGGRCCLGFLAKACGAEDHQILGQGTLAHARHADPVLKFPDWLLSSGSLRINSDDAWQLMQANDASGVHKDMPESELEDFIAKKFAEHGVTVRFEDTCPTNA